MKDLTQDDVDTIDNKAGQIRLLASLIANVHDCIEGGWRSEHLEDDAQHALGDLAEIINANAQAISVVVSGPGVNSKKGTPL
jgi:hypothetical protein